MFEIQISRYNFRFFFVFLLILLGILWQSTLVRAIVRNGQLDSNLVVNPILIGGTGKINSFVQLTNGKILVVGEFSTVSAGSASGIARLNADGSFDANFSGRANGEVIAAFPLSDGKILISGSFSQYNNITRNRIARLNSDGSLDASFNLSFGTEYVQVVAVQPDGKIIVNGTFTTVGGVPRNQLARLNTDGSLDLSFEVGSGISSAGVQKGLTQPDGKILMVGTFTSYNGGARNGIVRINMDGSLDTSFVPGIPGSSNQIVDLSLTVDGKIYVAGYIASSYTLFRLNLDGSLDASFNTGRAQTSSGSISSILAQPDGKVLVGGAFDAFFINGTLKISYRLIRFNADGSLDNTFTTQAGNGDVRTLRLQTDGKILVGGNFSYLNGASRGGIGRLNLDGSLDNSFVGFFGSFTTINFFHLLPDGKIYVGGNFTALGTSFRQFFARLNADGTVDNTFNLDSRVDNVIYSAAVQPDGKVVLGGYTGDDFSRTPSKGVWRVNSDGSLDTSFDARIPKLESVGTIALETDGKILIGGGFTAVNGVSRTRIARLNPDGSLDNSFIPVLGAPGVFVNKIVVQPDGNILVGGGFASVNGSLIANVVRLKPDGNVDTTFRIGNGANGTVSSFLITPTGKIFVGGNFSGFNGVSRSSLVKLNFDGTFDNSFKTVRISSGVNSIIQLPNGKILIGGSVSTFIDAAPRERIIRLLEDGSVDYSFDVGKITRNSSTGSVFQLALQTDGKILAAGSFDTVNGISRWGLARLVTFARPTPANFDYEGDGKSDLTVFRPSNGVWYRRNSYFNQFRAVKFGIGTDKIVPADYDGDFRTDIAVFRPSEGNWYIQNSSDNSFNAIQFGVSEDIPVARDFDVDGKADIAVFRPSSGVWYLLQSRDGFSAVQFGSSGDLPVAADYDGDGKTDIAVFRPSNGVWYSINSSNGGFSAVQFGLSGDVPVQGDFDGDFKTDRAVFRPSNGTWYLLQSSQGFKAVQFGQNGDKPVTADYDGDEKSDIAVYRAGIWYILSSSTNAFSATNFGLPNDIALVSLPN
jgi:uncharacterized delta-60 repeat protein